MEPAETHAVALIPLCYLNSNPGLLFEQRGVLGVHSEEGGCILVGYLLFNGYGDLLPEARPLDESHLDRPIAWRPIPVQKRSCDFIKLCSSCTFLEGIVPWVTHV